MNAKKIISKLLTIVIAASVVITVPAKKVYADAFKVVTLGANLTEKQKEDMLKYFGTSKKEANVLEVNIAEETKYLSGVASEKEIGSKSISCSYVEPTNSGGLKISTNNTYWVSESMIKNALITAGVENANIKVSAPFNVSGTAALTGILKGFENSSAGKKIDENKKKAANEELVVTGKLGEKIGQDQAAGLINEVKKEVVKDNPNTEEEIKNIVVNVINNYNYNLSQEDINKIIEVMKKINSLNLDFNQLKGQLNDVAGELKTVLKSEEAQGFIEKIISAISDFFKGIFGS